MLQGPRVVVGEQVTTRGHQTGTTDNRPRPGRQLVTSHDDDRQVRLRHLCDHFTTCTPTRNELFRGRISAQTSRSPDLHYNLLLGDKRFRNLVAYMKWTDLVAQVLMCTFPGCSGSRSDFPA